MQRELIDKKFVRAPAQISRGFTLAEIAIAIAVIALIIGGLLMPLATQYELSRVRETQRMLDTIRDSLIGYAIANGRLPCPALPNLVTGQSAVAGTEALTNIAPPAKPPGASGRWCQTDDGTGTDTALSAGVLPWVTLGVPETDAWGRRFTYAVTSIFADEGGCASTNPNVASFCTTATGQLSLNTRTSAGGPTPPIATGLAAIVVSHGRNGSSAFLPTGIQMAAGVGADEGRNALTIPSTAPLQISAAASFMTRDSIRIEPPCNDAVLGGQMCAFDDLVVGVDAARLVGRMVGAGRLP